MVSLAVVRETLGPTTSVARSPLETFCVFRTTRSITFEAEPPFLLEPPHIGKMAYGWDFNALTSGGGLQLNNRWDSYVPYR